MFFCAMIIWSAWGIQDASKKKKKNNLEDSNSISVVLIKYIYG